MSYAIAEAVSKLATVGYVVNQMTEYAVWVEFSGHVNSVSVRVSEGKTKETHHKRIFDDYVHLSIGFIGLTEERILTRLEEMERYLNGLLAVGEKEQIRVSSDCGETWELRLINRSNFDPAAGWISAIGEYV